ncbi:MAG: TrkA C-terminal domain-containing protein [Verrucomicrobia bacterium]|nr:TrkA C-terminal domain-containing protein [Verrucomicrobiota bacterium]
MSYILALFAITVISLLIIRIGSTALMMTGLSWDTASFQSYSAFFGVGFTTKEAEMVVNHPVRRRIIRDLILAGNIGLTSGMVTLIVTVLQEKNWLNPLTAIGAIVGTIVVLLLLFKIGIFQRLLDHVIQRALEKAGLVRALDYELLLRIQSGFCVSEIEILPKTCLAGLMLKVTRPADWGVLIMAISRDGKVMDGIPGPRTVVQSGDVVTAYGHDHDLKKLLLAELPAATS